MLSCVGKILIVASIVFQAYVLFSDAETIASFDTKLKTLWTDCNCVPPHVKELIQEHARLAIVGLLGSSALMLVFKWCFVKLLVLIGLISLLYIEHQPFTKIPCIGCQGFWQKLAVIGAIIYIMGNDCCAKKCAKV